ncbi:MAG: universal stress protein [Acidobacteria bacterium]|nr:MAG: universal stress protein [Acidobacteriota bacterium]
MTFLKSKNILCPVDLSSVSYSIVKWAGLFARTFGVPVEVLYADWWEPPRYFTEAQIQQLSHQEQEGLKALRVDLESLVKSAAGDLAPYSINVVEGHPAERILDRAKELMSGLIVMGSHGRTGIARLRLGSVSEDVVRASACPVLIVKSVKDVGSVPRIENILCPINFTSLSQQSLEIGSEIASAFGARLWVVHAINHEEIKLDEVHQRICDWVPQVVRGRCGVSEVVRQGHPAEQIVLMAREHSADPIVMGAQHRPFLEFTALGTTTERVMRHSDASVLVVPVRNADTRD